MRALGLLSIVCLLALAACVGPASKSYVYIPPPTPGGRICSNQCREAQDYCRETCEFVQRQCTSGVQAQALVDYEKYMSDRFLHESPIEMRARDFEHAAPCDKSFQRCTNKCEEQYSGCFQDCGGKVEKTTSCQFLCF